MGTVTRDISEARRIAEEREQLLSHEQIARQEAESANEQLRESEERFRLTIDECSHRDGARQRSTAVSFASTRRSARSPGYSADELTKLTCQDITHPDDLDTDVELAGKAARGEIPRYQLEKRYIRKDGSIVDVMLSVSVLRGPDGEAALLHLPDRRHHGAQTCRGGASSVRGQVLRHRLHRRRRDHLGRRGSAHHDLQRGCGAHLRLRQGRGDRDAARPAHSGTLSRDPSRALRRLRRGRGSRAQTMAERREIFGLRKNGEEFPAEGSISKVTVGGATFFSVVLRDVTYRKSVEEALQRAVAARDDVLGIVAHDLRNPLNTILMQASLLERLEPEPERRDQTPRLVITRSAKRMNTSDPGSAGRGRSSRRDSSRSSANDSRRRTSSGRQWRRRRRLPRRPGWSYDSRSGAASTTCGAIATVCSRCSTTSSATRSSSRRRAVTSW